MDNDTLEALEKWLNGKGLQSLWIRIAEMVKTVTGDVKVDSDGTLQEQIDKTQSEIDDLKNSLIKGKVNFGTTSEDGSYLTTEDGSNIIAEFKI